MNSNLYLGVMSGTSLDGVDIALVDFSAQPLVKLTSFTPMPEDLRQEISLLIQQGTTHLQQLGELDHRLGCLYAHCINQFLSQYQLQPQQIRAIGIHGQTIWHSPQAKFPFTTQIGDMHLVAARTGITTIADFRRTDMAQGGQGAPLVPAFHQACFFDPNFATVVLNIGGISNVSLLIPDQPVTGFDTGPGNCLLDQWIYQHQGKNYDQDGNWAMSGTAHQQLLQHLLDEPFFKQPPPKSTGRELFNLNWLAKKINSFPIDAPFSAQDVQATLAQFSAETVSLALKPIQTSLPKRLLVCGGGAKNQAIMQYLHNALSEWKIQTTTDLGLDIDYVEAAAFAWLAYRRLHNLPSNLPTVTGAMQEVSLGAIFPSTKEML